MYPPFNAVALRPIRLKVKTDEIIVYTGVTFPADPAAGVALWLNRCKSVGFLVDDGYGLRIDALDKDGDIVETYPINRKGFEYLRRSLKFKREDHEPL